MGPKCSTASDTHSRSVFSLARSLCPAPFTYEILSHFYSSRILPFSQGFLARTSGEFLELCAHLPDTIRSVSIFNMENRTSDAENYELFSHVKALARQKTNIKSLKHTNPRRTHTHRKKN